MKKLFPPEIIGLSVESLLKRHSIRSSVIYISVLLSVCLALVSLFLITTDVSVKANGVLKSPGERVAVSVPSTGRVAELLARENMQVSKGDTLLVIAQETWPEQERLYGQRKIELQELLTDLRQLTNLNQATPSVKELALKHPVYIQAYKLYVNKQTDAANRLETATKTYIRDKSLLDEKVIPLADFEPVEAEYIKAGLSIETLCEEQLDRWHSEELQYSIELRQLVSDMAQLVIRQQQLVVTAPVNGSVQSLAGIQTTSFVVEGQKVLEISPDSVLQAECYISPRDIGLINGQQKARIQVDAFNHNEWGVLGGLVSEISDDVVVHDNQAYFKLFCKLDKDHLQLKNGAVGRLKKGMSIHAHFIVARRTLFQLLYDKADKWINPNQVTE